jgi:drug/metabolite transporter (DMT)-like permease
MLFIPAILVLWATGFFSIEIDETVTYSLGYLVLLAVLGTALAKTLFNKLVQISSPIFSSSVTYLIPLVAVFWGMLDGEKIYPSQIMAGGVILLGIYLSNRGKS